MPEKQKKKREGTRGFCAALNENGKKAGGRGGGGRREAKGQKNVEIRNTGKRFQK
jgi:hypothetical protein